MGSNVIPFRKHVQDDPDAWLVTELQAFRSRSKIPADFAAVVCQGLDQKSARQVLDNLSAFCGEDVPDALRQVDWSRLLILFPEERP
ncbi:MAG: hypothetical protein AAF439_13105 [Pseudomonadota bacterium]